MRLRAALALAGAALGLGGCTRPPALAEAASASSVADTVHVAAEDESFFTDVPVDGFDALTPHGQAAVAARANRAKCDCGCFGHSVNACLHLKETCDTAVRMAAQFIADARLGEQIAGIAAPPPGEGAERPQRLTAPAGPSNAATESSTRASAGPAGSTGPRPTDAPLFPGAPPIVVVTPPDDGEAPEASAPAGMTPAGTTPAEAAAAEATAPAGASGLAPVAPPVAVTGPGGVVVGVVPGGAALASAPTSATPAPSPGLVAPMSPALTVPGAPSAGAITPITPAIGPVPGSLAPPAGTIAPAPGQVTPGANAPPGSVIPPAPTAPASPSGAAP